MATLPDNAIALMSDDEVDHYGVVRVADEFVVDLMKSACGIQYDEASGHVDWRDVNGVDIPVADKELLIRTKATVRPSDATDVRFLRLRIGEDEKNSRG